jgi:hypothetical protein
MFPGMVRTVQGHLLFFDWKSIRQIHRGFFLGIFLFTTQSDFGLPTNKVVFHQLFGCRVEIHHLFPRLGGR